LLLVANALNFFSLEGSLASLARFGFSAFTALIYLAVGSLVWLFARQRRVALLLFAFSLAMAVTFANETASGPYVAWFAAATGVSVVVALASFAILLLNFPYNYLAALRARRQTGRRCGPGRLCLWIYITGHVLLAMLMALYAVAKNVLAFHPPDWLALCVNCYYLFALGSILLTIIGAHYLSKNLRTRQQFL